MALRPASKYFETCESPLPIAMFRMLELEGSNASYMLLQPQYRPSQALMCKATTNRLKYFYSAQATAARPYHSMARGAAARSATKYARCKPESENKNEPKEPSVLYETKVHARASWLQPTRQHRMKVQENLR